MTTDIASSGEIELQLALEQICDKRSPLNAILMLQVLYNIHKRILDEPSVDKHYRLYTKGKIFEKYVWRWEGAKAYFLYIGWITCGDFLILSKSQPVDLIVKVIEDVFRKNKKVQLLYSGSQSELADGRKLHSISVDSNLNEDEFLATYTNIEAPPERDSAIGSGMDDDDDVDIKSIGRENDILKGLQSKEHSLGDEAYIVVDFVNDSNCMPKEPSQNDTMEMTNEKSSTVDNMQIPDNSEILIENSSPFTTVKLSSNVDSNFTFVPSIPDELQHNNDKNISQDLNKPKLPNEDSYIGLPQREVLGTSIHSTNEELIVNDGENMELDAEECKVIVDEEKVRSSEKAEDKIEINEFKEDVKIEKDIKVAEKVDVTLEKCDSAKKRELEQKVTPTKIGRTKVFSAGRGLKKAKEDRTSLDETKEKHGVIPITDSPIEIGNASPTLHKDLNITPVHTSSKKKSSIDTMVHSPKLPRTSSLKSLNSESSPTSIVKQNKLLFDQQIANELKTKYSSPQDIIIPRQGSMGKGGVNGIFERRGSLKEKGSNSYLDTCELDLTGIVAGARSVFEGVKDVPGNYTKNDIKTSTSNMTIKELVKTQNKDVDKTHSLKQTPVDCKSIITNTVPELSSRNRKKKKFPFKKPKGKIDKKQGNNKTVELISAKLIDANQFYDERAIDVETITSVHESSYEDGKSESFSSSKNDIHDDNMNNQQTETTLNLSELDEKPEAESIPIISASTPLASTDIPGRTGDDESAVRRNRSKKRRLCKTREPDVLNNSELISNDDEPMEIASDPIIHSNNVSNNNISDTFVSATIVNLIPDDEEEILSETLLTDDPICNWSFDKLRELEDGDQLVSEKQPDTYFKMEVYADPLITLPSIEPIKIDIDSLQNESSIDEGIIDENDISALVSPVSHMIESDTLESIKSNTELREANNADINVGETVLAKKEDVIITVSEPDDDDLTSILDEMSCRSDITGSFCDGDSMSRSLSLNMDNSTNTVDEKRKKKKKMFPFNIKLGKKNKNKSKGELSSEDTSSESSYKISKKKKKSKSIDNVHEIGQTMSTSSIESFPKVSSSSSLKSPNLDQHVADDNVFKEQVNTNEKVKSKKMHFFKKKSGATAPVKLSSSFTVSPSENNQLDPNGKLDGITVSKPSTPTTPNHHQINGHTSHTTGHTNHTNGHASVTRDKLI